MYSLTAGHRYRLGPVEVFNPRGVSGIPSTFRWNITAGCADPTEALLRADGLVGDVATGDMALWLEKSAAALAAAMHAADLIGGDMRDVWAWSNSLGYHLIDQARQVPGASLELFGCPRRARQAEPQRRLDQADDVQGPGVDGGPGDPRHGHRARGGPVRRGPVHRSNGTIYLMADGDNSPGRAAVPVLHQLRATWAAAGTACLSLTQARPRPADRD